ncbi:hypothetical protein [Armatimonas rosea]|uniref:Uncharacterized protein n=1 Tax=Armatimonas rosea TaxID=685828 RepID=A0A7W9SWT8_ARMRO|nr:hypothetical protein [Armatimonas rosea]MBB6053443.1 hypothetical protein [Armatimonas rosea]
MAVSDLENIISLLNRWETHWSDVNAALGASELILAPGFTVASLAEERAAFIADEQQIQAAENPAQGAATERDALKKALRTRISQLRAAVQGMLPGTRYVGMLPLLPATNAGEGIFLKALEDSSQLWATINSDTSLSEFVPLTLPVGYSQAQFATDTATLRGYYQSATQNREHARTLRGARAARRKALLARLTQYRKVLVARLPAGHPLLGTMPQG